MPKPKLPFKKFSWTPELAYAVGLIVTDGNLSKDGRHIVFRSADYQLIQTFKSCLNLKNKVGITKNTSGQAHYRIQFSNVQLYNWLINIGINPAKTHTIAQIKIPSRFFRDFLRGHLDGDGSIITYRDTYNVYRGKTYLNTRIYTKFISASKQHIRWLHKMIAAHSPIRGVLSSIKPKGNRVPMWSIRFAKYESLKLLKWLYYRDDLPTLKRKHQTAKQLLSRITNNKLIR